MSISSTFCVTVCVSCVSLCLCVGLAWVRRKLLKRKIGDSRVSSNGLVPLLTRAHTVRAPVLMRGWISKEGGAVRRSFSNRYFVLMSTATSTTLTYYLKKAGDDSEGAAGGPPFGLSERGSIDLKGGVFTQGTAHSTVASASGKQRYVLDLKSCSEGERWVQALHEHIDYACHQQTIIDQLRQGDAMCSFKAMGV